MLEDRASGGVDLVVIFHIAGFELDLVDEYSIFIVQFDIHVIRFIFTHTCVIQGNRFCLGVADVRAVPDGWAGWEDWAGGLTGWEGFTVSF